MADSKQKLSAEERKKQRAKEKRREDLRRTFKRIGIFALIFLAFLAFSTWNNRDRGVGPLGEVYDTVRAYPTACDAEQPPYGELMTFETPSAATGDFAVITTSCGVIEIELEDGSAAAASFSCLADAGFYDGTAVHRIVQGFIVEAGDPTATGDGTAGYLLTDEPNEGVTRGSMYLVPGLGPNRASSQFGFALSDDAAVSNSASIIGTVVSGLEVLDTIGAIETTLSPKSVRTQPVETIYIESIEITTQGG